MDADELLAARVEAQLLFNSFESLNVNIRERDGTLLGRTEWKQPRRGAASWPTFDMVTQVQQFPDRSKLRWPKVVVAQLEFWNEAILDEYVLWISIPVMRKERFRSVRWNTKTLKITDAY